MAGIYIHIPYCRQACRYCDFHFEVSVWNKKELIPIMYREIEERKDYLGGEEVDTIYFGGGTPSVLTIEEIIGFTDIINNSFTISTDAELSFEANPEDLTKEYLNGLKKTSINRLSVGIQSFNNSDLTFMHRVHNADQAIQAVKDAQDLGFNNISIDLIYGIPMQEANIWENNLECALNLGIQHFSAYHLTYETGTIFDHWRKKGRINPISEEESLKQFKKLLKSAVDKGFEHYEISNFALPGYRSRHNSGYWQQKKYLGIGPSAHSYDGRSRSWNFSNNRKYIESLMSGNIFYDSEILTSEDLYNEFVMTNLRTREGINILQLHKEFGNDRLEYFLKKIKIYIISGHVKSENGHYSLTQDGIFISDFLISEIFI